MLDVKVIIVEDERLVAQDIAQILEDAGYVVCAIASDGETAIKKIVEFSPDLVLLDIQIKGLIDGIDVAKMVQSFCDIPIIYLTAFSDAETLKRAQSTSPMAYVIKPFRSEQLLSSITIALTTYASQKEDYNESQLKNKFLSIVTHELRNPINAILGFSECLQSEMFGSINAEQIEALQIINSSGSSLLSMINDVLDLSRLEVGKFKLHLELMPIAQMCQESLGYVSKEAIQKQIQIEAKIPSNLPYLMLDERRILQVLINLLKNAIKFTPEGGNVTLEATHHILPLTENKSSVQITIIDTGIGISSENLDKLFQPFSQVDNTLTRKYEGMGLGTRLVKKLVELHGGKVDVTSEVGVGSCFMIELPCSNSYSASLAGNTLAGNN